MNAFTSSPNATNPNRYGQAPIRGKVWRRKNKSQMQALRYELSQLPKHIKEAADKMSNAKVGSSTHVKQKERLTTLQRRQRELQLILK